MLFYFFRKNKEYVKKKYYLCKHKIAGSLAQLV